jgi:hypothetical protein
MEKLHTAISSRVPRFSANLFVTRITRTTAVLAFIHPPFRGDLKNLSPSEMLFLSKANYWTPDLVQHLESYSFIFKEAEVRE